MTTIIDGTPGDNSLSGTEVGDFFNPDGIDHINGLGGNDILYGRSGNDVLSGGDGNDILWGGAGADVLDGGAGTDTAVYLDSGAAVTVDLSLGTGLGGTAQGDTLTGIEQVIGSNFGDHLIGDSGRNVFDGQNGNDTLSGNDGDDALYGGFGADALDGGNGADHLVGQAGIDTIHGGAGADSVDGGTENDLLFGDDGDDYLYGGAGAGADQLDGGNGNDVLQGGAGADTLVGGAGIDTASYAGSSAGVMVDLFFGTGVLGDAESDTLVGIESILGSNLSDVLGGDDGVNALWGEAGNDVITGRGGGDTLAGGAGFDRFVYLSLSDSAPTIAGRDTITDFSTGDRIDLSAIDADGQPSTGNQAFTFIGTSDFTHRSGEVRIIDYGNGIQGIYINADQFSGISPIILDGAILVISDHTLTAADFVL